MYKPVDPDGPAYQIRLSASKALELSEAALELLEKGQFDPGRENCAKLIRSLIGSTRAVIVLATRVEALEAANGTP